MKFINTLLALLLWYLIFAFILGGFDLLEWHIVGKIIFVIVTLILVRDFDED